MTERAMLVTIYTIGQGGEPAEGWMAPGRCSMREMVESIQHFDGTEITEHHALNHVLGRLECFNCGPRHRTETGHLKTCDGDDDSWHWNFRAGPVHTVIMRDGRSIHLHFPGKVADG
jgi:hypothetical protein